MATSNDGVFNRIAEVVIAPAGDNANKRAIVHVVLESPDGKQVRCPLTVKAALSLHAMLSSRLKRLVSDAADSDDA